MSDHATPNLPSRDFDVTVTFYRRIGFTTLYRDSSWLTLGMGTVVVDFFPFPDLDPATSSFCCCLRLDDVDAFGARCEVAGVPRSSYGWPRLELPTAGPTGVRIGALLDPDASLLRLVQNR